MNTTTIDNNAFDGVATRVRFNTRVKSRVKAREERERARLDKATEKVAKHFLPQFRICWIFIYILI